MSDSQGRSYNSGGSDLSGLPHLPPHQRQRSTWVASHRNAQKHRLHFSPQEAPFYSCSWPPSPTCWEQLRQRLVLGVLVHSLGVAESTRKKISLRIPTTLFCRSFSPAFFGHQKFPRVLTMTTSVSSMVITISHI